jgi:uncharacterized protein (DUF2252 family)
MILSVPIVERMLRKDVQDARTSGTVAETVRLSSGRAIKHCVISYSAIKRRRVRERCRKEQVRRTSQSRVISRRRKC